MSQETSRTSQRSCAAQQEFKERIMLSQTLEKPFIDTFNECCISNKPSYRIEKFGIESTRLIEAHSHFCTCRDTTSLLVRYLPDALLVCTSRYPECPPTLVEFKVVQRGVKRKWLFDQVLTDYKQKQSRQEHKEKLIELEKKEDVFGIGYDALREYLTLYEKLNVSVIVVALAKFRRRRRGGQMRPHKDWIRAQFVQKIIQCNDHGSEGRHGHITNTHFGSFEPLVDFFEKDPFRIDHCVMNAVCDAVQIALDVYDKEKNS